MNITEGCPLRRSRDLYYIQEENKLFEHNARWSCGVCGKAFYRQQFLDLHMENKHQDLLVKDEVLRGKYSVCSQWDVLSNSQRNRFLNQSKFHVNSFALRIVIKSVCVTSIKCWGVLMTKNKIIFIPLLEKPITIHSTHYMFNTTIPNSYRRRLTWANCIQNFIRLFGTVRAFVKGSCH